MLAFASSALRSDQSIENIIAVLAKRGLKYKIRSESQSPWKALMQGDYDPDKLSKEYDLSDCILYQEEGYNKYLNIFGEEEQFALLLLLPGQRRLIVDTTLFDCDFKEFREMALYAYLNALECLEGNDIILVMPDDSQMRSWTYWLKSAIIDKKYTSDQNRSKRIRVLTYSELLDLFSTKPLNEW